MTKKLSRRDFLKGTGKITSALAAIWAVGADIPPPVEEAPEPKPVEEEKDVWNEEYHPYHRDTTMFFPHSKKHEWWI